MAGYSNRSLVEKLGIKPGHKVYLGNPPDDYGKTLNVVREIGLHHGLVDIKVCAVDNIWSGLKFVVRVKDRK